MQEQNSKSFLQKLKEKQSQQEASKKEAPKMAATACPNCGAGRAKQDGLTHCAYCGFEFIAVQLSNGIHLKKEDNSNK